MSQRLSSALAVRLPRPPALFTLGLGVGLALGFLLALLAA